MRSPKRLLVVTVSLVALTVGSGTALAATHGRAATHKSHSATHKSGLKHSCTHASSSGSSSSSTTGS